MGKKGKGGKSGGKKGGKSSWQPTLVPDGPLMSRSLPASSCWLTIQVRGVVWRVMDFTMRVPASMCVYELRSLIEQRHGGGVTEFTIYKEEVHQRNKLVEPSTLLNDLEFSVARDEPRLFYYDFEARVDDCPLLLRPPHDLQVEALHRQEREEKEAKESRYAALKSGKSSVVSVES